MILYIITAECGHVPVDTNGCSCNRTATVSIDVDTNGRVDTRAGRYYRDTGNRNILFL